MKVRLLHDLSRIIWYLKQHAEDDTQSSDHGLCYEMSSELQVDLEKHSEKLRQAIEGLAKEGKFT